MLRFRGTISMKRRPFRNFAFFPFLVLSFFGSSAVLHHHISINVLALGCHRGLIDDNNSNIIEASWRRHLNGKTRRYACVLSRGEAKPIKRMYRFYPFFLSKLKPERMDARFIAVASHSNCHIYS